MAQHGTYLLSFELSFWPGDHPCTNYPGEDKLWLDIWLDDFATDDDGRRTYLYNVYDGDGFELPMRFLALDEEERVKTWRKEYLDRAAECAAKMLVEHGIEQYEVDDIDLMAISWDH